MSSKLTPEAVENVLKSSKTWRSALAYFNWASNQEGYSHTCYTYNAMASVLSSARQNAPLRELAESLPNSRCLWTPGALGYFLRCLGSQGLVHEANCLFDQMKISGLCALNCYSYNCLLEVIARRGGIDLLEHRLNEMRNFGCPIDKYALTPTLHCYCNAGDLDKALIVFNEMKAKGWVDQHVLTILVVSFCKKGKMDAAFELIEWAEGNLHITMNEKTSCILIHSFMQEQRVREALVLYDKMKKIGYLPDVSVYDVLISGLCKNKEIGKAIKLCSQMQESGISPDVRIISQILSCIHEERSMIDFVQDTFVDLNEEKRMPVFSSTLTYLVRGGYAEKVYYLLKATMRSGTSENIQAGKLSLSKEMPNVACFQVVIDGLCSATKLDMALDLFNDIYQSGCRLSVLLFNNLIHCLSNADRLSECFQLLTRMKETEFEPTHFTFNCIFGCLCRREDSAGALDLLKEMRSCGHEPWIKHYTQLVKKLCKHGKAAEASNFLADMTKAGFLPDIIAYSATIDGFINIDELDHSLQLFREICERGYCPDVVAYNTIIKGLCKVQRITEAEEILNEMLRKGLTPSVITYNLLINGWCKLGDMDRAIHWFLRMTEREREPNVITYTTLVDGLCNTGKPDDALKFWSEMEQKGCHPNRIGYMALIHGLCKCQKLDIALIYLHKMEEKDMLPDMYIYEVLIASFVSNGNITMASKLSEKMTKYHTAS